MGKEKTLMVFTTILLTFSFFSFALKPVTVSAVDDVPPVEDRVDSEGIWSTVTSFVESLTNAVGESIAQLVGKFFTAVGDFTLATLCPQCTTSYERIQANPNLPTSMKQGVVGIAEQQVMAMFNAQPRIDVVAHLAEEWIPGHREQQSLYAAGYDDLLNTGIDVLWSFTRNIAYLGFVVIMIIVGFMIMFRHKIGGQMLVTVGNSIPRVVVGLILVTFSFAIAGIILDISGIFMRVIQATLDSNIQIHNIAKLVWGTITSGWVLPTGTVVTGLGIAGIAILVKATLGAAALIGVFVVLIVLGILIWGAFKLWIALVKSYLALLLNVIVAPIVIMAGSLPGNQAMISNIFKSMLRNALVFPVAFAIVNIPYYLSEIPRVTFSFPETVFEGASMDTNIGTLLLAIAKIIAIFVAAQTPNFMKAIIPATASKSGADAAAAVKEGFSKVPLIGGMFK